MTSKPTLNACLRNKKIYLNRITITLLGNPSHINFWYDEKETRLYVTAAGKGDLDAYEIRKNYWHSTRSCEVAQFSFLKALQYRLNWENDSKYSYSGTLIEREGFPIVAFDMTEGTTKIRRTQRHAKVEEQRMYDCESANVGDGDKAQVRNETVL